MKTALSRMLELFAGHDRSEKSNPTHRGYCICGALKPQVEKEKRETSLKTDSRPQGMNMARK
jgi:hypothetical protein